MNIIKYLQAQGIDTRKGCQWLVKHQLVQINGDTIASDKAEVQPENVHSLTIEGEDALVIPLPYFYILINKPADYEVSHKPRDYPSVFTPVARSNPRRQHPSHRTAGCRHHRRAADYQRWAV